MPKAEILTIGTELLLGEILDSNAQYLARQLRDAGIDLYWTSTVGDNEARIAEAVKLTLTRSDILICTGGLGPTIDDVTREAISLALNVELEYKEFLWQQIRERFARFGREPSENNKRQAYIPAGAEAIENPIGSAPAFLVEIKDKVIIALPGVPKEMSRLMEDSVLPFLSKKFGASSVIRSRILHTAGVGESLIDEKITDLEKLHNPTLGIAAHAGSVDLRLTAKASSSQEAEGMLNKLEVEIRERLGDWVFGVDDQRLADVILDKISAKNWHLTVIEAGLGGALLKAFEGKSGSFAGGEQLGDLPLKEDLPKLAADYAANAKADVCLAALLHSSDPQSELHIALCFPDQNRQFAYPFGGASELGPEWAANLSLSLLHRALLKEFL
jgi:competence/damage-inducible protein CinA-like protein